MLKSLFLLLFIFYCHLLPAQFGPKQIISTEANLPRGIKIGDINGDGNIDIITAARSTNNLAWFKNENGLGNFGEINPITDSEENFSLDVGDIDNDGDLDVVSISFSLDNVFWVENIDGNGSFGAKNIITSAENVTDIALGDVDNDGLLDIIHVSISARMVLHKNIDNGNFGNGVMISEFETNGASVNFVDIDGDGDLDILNSNSGNVTVNWYENTDGLGTFGSANIIDTASPAFSTISAVGADVDGDGDMDVVTAATGNTFISWHENLDSQGTFGEDQLISNEVETAIAVFSVDIDNDNDMDVLSASALDNKIAWYANDGSGNFGDQQIITDQLNQPRDVIAADIDSDGDMDVFSVSQNDNTIAWYENLTILSADENNISKITLHPNPVKDTLYINAHNNIITSLKLHNLLGQEIDFVMDETSNINMSQYPSGIYFLEIASSKSKVIKRILKI